MTSTAQPTNQSRSAGSISAPGRSGQTGTSPVTVVSGQPSYAAATQKGASPNVSQPNTANMANGGPAAVQLNPSESTNGKSAITPAVPTIINGNEHRRSPSVAVAGANGAPSAGLSKNIQFGQVNAGGSPAAAPPAGLSNPSPNSLGVTAPMNPRNTSPQTSPSPIPQPAAVSGGRPPSGLQGPGNGVNFGNLNDSNVSSNINILKLILTLHRDKDEEAHKTALELRLHNIFAANLLSLLIAIWETRTCLVAVVASHPWDEAEARSKVRILTVVVFSRTINIVPAPIHEARLACHLTFPDSNKDTQARRA